MGEGIVRSLGWTYTHFFYLKWVISKELLYSTESSAQ